MVFPLLPPNLWEPPLCLSDTVSARSVGRLLSLRVSSCMSLAGSYSAVTMVTRYYGHPAGGHVVEREQAQVVEFPQPDKKRGGRMELIYLLA